jgi:hypothetical protein
VNTKTALAAETPSENQAQSTTTLTPASPETGAPPATFTALGPRQSTDDVLREAGLLQDGFLDVCGRIRATTDDLTRIFVRNNVEIADLVLEAKVAYDREHGTGRVGHRNPEGIPGFVQACAEETHLSTSMVEKYLRIARMSPGAREALLAHPEAAECFTGLLGLVQEHAPRRATRKTSTHRGGPPSSPLMERARKEPEVASLLKSMRHEAINELFHNAPRLAPSILRRIFGVALPRFRRVRVEAIELSEVLLRQFRPDSVVQLYQGRQLVYAIVLEVQLARKPKKRKIWPVYLTHLRLRLGCPTCLLVVCPDGEAIPTGHPGWDLKPMVLGPTKVPIVTDPAEATRSPELSVLSVMAHGQGEQGLAIGKAVLAGAAGLDEGRQIFYADVACQSVNDAARAALETMMKGYEFQSDFAKKYFGQGLEKGRKEGREEGVALGEARALFTVLDARGIKVSKAVRQRVTSCADVAQLQQWLRRAPAVKKATELFD